MFDFNSVSVELAKKYSREYTFQLGSTLGLNPTMTLTINKIRGSSYILKDVDKMTSEELITQVGNLIK